MLELTILKEEVRDLNDKESNDYVIHRLLESGFDLGEGSPELVSHTGNYRDYIRFTQTEN
jgi:hypothetical protein